jgi:hypothetical protein
MDSLPYVNNKELNFSKKGSGLPLTNMRIEDNAPCMKPREMSIGYGKYYPTEAHFVNGGCTEARTNGFFFDGRYEDLGMEATQYDV